MHKQSIAVILAGLFAIAAGNAKANDSAYRLRFKNSTPMVVWVNQTGSGCQSWTYPAPDFPISIGPHQSREVGTFFRASHCHGKQGQLYLRVAQTFDENKPSTESYVSQLSMDYSAGGDMNVTVESGSISTGFPYQYARYVDPDTSNLSFEVINWTQTSLASALAGPCLKTGSATEDAFGSLLQYADVGTVTKQKVEKYSAPLKYFTQYSVTDAVWGFRGIVRVELSDLKSGFLVSRATRILRGVSYENRESKWAAFGPQLVANDAPAALGLRLLALGSTAEPMSQVVPVALTYKTAYPFAPAGDPVYAFRLSPMSQVFSLNEKCATVEDTEAQLLPLGGTAIFDLMRSFDGKTWQKWIKDDDWDPSDVVPSN
ncbi:hypothetical protein [Comamonas sp. JC664]|uniref:hypothetical protein n=1 Tax=Comamonas sp. JC664 TaxID=2801917 RepID=UPI00174CD762|nr:hypothetical protein [Comamonas sp. JC664]MBL0698797.1 hypothetical protein [Comamonas sp. JC664]GHG78952.1 hypothetical protein GCM10012319_30260 [Comamonas sp. KCTC 72670]